MAVNGKLYPLPTLAPPTDGSASGSSALTNEPMEGLPLAWPTATARDYKGAYSEASQEITERNLLPDAVKKWSTPRASDSQPASKSRRPDKLQLREEVARQDWPTPTASEGTKIPSQANYGQQGLSNHPAIVGLPTRPKGTKDRKGQPDSGPPRTASGRPDLERSSTSGSRPESWATPQAHDAKGPKTPEQIEVMRTKGAGVKNLNEQVGWATPTGDDANNATRTSGDFQSLTRQAGKLNPSWVETLMGLPLGHTQLPVKFAKPKAAKK